MISRIYFTFILIFLISCSSPRFILDKNKVSVSDLLNGIQADQDKIHTINGESRVSIETTEFSSNFFADILYNDHDSLLINVSGPFGIKVGKLFLGNERFIFLNQFANQFYSGNTEDFRNRNFLQFPLKISEISDFFVGKDKFNNMKIFKYDTNNDLFFIQSKDGNLSYNIWIDNFTGKIKKIEYINQDTLILIKEYDNFIKINDTFFPKHIKLTRPLEKQVVSVFYNVLKLNQEIDPEEFSIKISDSARQIDINLIELEGLENQ